MTFESIAGSDSSAIEVLEGAVARTPTEWNELWSRHVANLSPPPVAPTVDFTNKQVIAVFLGSRPSGCYSVTVTTVERSQARLLVTYRERIPPPSIVCTMAVVNPAHFVAVASSSLPVVFQAE